MEKRKRKKRSVIIDVHVGLRQAGSQWNKKFICYNCITFNIFGSILKDFFYTNFTVSIEIDTIKQLYMGNIWVQCPVALNPLR